MEFVCDKVMEILSKKAPECPFLDYKEVPYNLKAKKPEFIKDTLALLNAIDATGKDKYIIIGVRDGSLDKKGIIREEMPDDNEWQNLVKYISPRPHIETGTVEYDGNCFGYIFISKDNDEWPYEANTTVFCNPKLELKESNAIFRGQSYIRFGTTKEVLSQQDREKLVQIRIQKTTVLSDRLEGLMKTDRVLLYLSMIGGWDENNEFDISIIETITGCSYEQFKSDIIRISNEDDSLVSYANGIWNTADHERILLAVAMQLIDSDFEKFMTVADKVLLDCNPFCHFYDSPEWGKLIMNSGCEYSNHLIKGISETIAIIQNNMNQFDSLNYIKTNNATAKLVKSIIDTPQWELFLALENSMSTIAEINPSLYIKRINNALDDKNSSLCKYLDLNDSTNSMLKHGNWLKDSIASLAKDEKLFSEAVEILLCLSEYHDSFLDQIVYLILPWLPQTNASLLTRTNVFAEMDSSLNNAIWKVLRKLFPSVTSTSFPIPKTKFYRIAEPNQPTVQEYRESSIKILHLALEKLECNSDRIIDVLKVIPLIDMELQVVIQNAIIEHSQSMSCEDKEKIWNCIQDIIIHHKKYSDKEWDLDKDRIEALSTFADSYIPDSSRALAARYFRNDQFGLLANYGNYAEEQIELHGKQLEILEEIYVKSGIRGVLSFSNSIENKQLLGRCLSEIITIDDLKDTINDLIDNEELASGLFRFLDNDSLESIVTNVDEPYIVDILAERELSKELLDRVNQMNEKQQDCFWERLNHPIINMNASIELLISVVESLNNVSRYNTSIDILTFWLHNNQLPVQYETVIAETLLQVSDDYICNDNEYRLHYLIGWLQDNAEDSDSVERVEWKYLSILRGYNGYIPNNLYLKISNDPDFFLAVLYARFGDMEHLEKYHLCYPQTTSNIFAFLNEWHTIPGSKPDGSIDISMLRNWVRVVEKETDNTDLKEYAMTLLGHTFYYAPADESFFINKDIARIIHNDKSESIGSGYEAEAFNSRGLHIVDETGREDFKLRDDYYAYAKQADERGLYRFAANLRNIAKMFDRCGYEAIEDMKRLHDSRL